MHALRRRLFGTPTAPPDPIPLAALPAGPAATPDSPEPSLGSKDLSNHRKDRFTAVLRKYWPLAVHCATTVAITCFMLFYVKDRHFNLTERKPSVSLIDGTGASSNGYAPLQADITTLLSIFLSIFRWILGTWASALCWYSIFLLMERTGLPHGDLQWMVTNKILRVFSYFRNPLFFFTGTVLLVTTLIQYSAPLLAGAITWIPSNRLLALDATIGVADVTVTDWQNYVTNVQLRERASIQAGGFANIAWGHDVEKGTLKRVIPSGAKLNLNSTLANVTLPYFGVTSLEWISDPQQTLTPEQRNVSNGVIPILSTRPGQSPFSAQATLAFIPEPSDWRTVWSNSAANSGPFPPFSTATDSRILVLYISWQPGDSNCMPKATAIFGNISSTVQTYFDDPNCFAFARVNYTAGVGVCSDCRFSSNSTVQNDTEISVRADPMTREALRLMPDVTGNLALMNTSIPFPWDNIDDYVTEMLVRSYSGAWMALNLGGTSGTTYSPTLPASRADINLARVYAWLGLQLSVLVLGLAFFVIQSGSQFPAIKDTNMKLVPFYLDTSAVTKPDAYGKLEDKADLKVNPGRSWEVTVKESVNAAA